MSIAPQKEAPIQIPPTTAAIPIVVELDADPVDRVHQLALLDVREEPLDVEDHAALDVSGLLTTWPKTNRTRSANGKIASIRL